MRRVNISSRLSFAIKVGLTAVLLAYVLSNVPLEKIAERLVAVDRSVFLLALATYPLVAILGALRWQIYTNSVFDGRRPVAFFQKHYWTGLGIGYTSPAGVGLDWYRWFIGSRAYGNQLANAGLILFEKLIVLAAGLMFAACMLYFRPIPGAAWLLDVCAGAVILLCSGYALVKFGRLELIGRLHKWLVKIDGSFAERAHTSRRFAGLAPVSGNSSESSLAAIFAVKNVVFVGVLSLTIQVLSAVALYFMYLAIGDGIPFLLCLLVAPLLFIAVQIPISISGIGVREVASLWILVPFEISDDSIIAVAVLAYVGLILNAGLSALVVLCVRHPAD